MLKQNNAVCNIMIDVLPRATAFLVSYLKWREHVHASIFKNNGMKQNLVT